MKYLGWARNCFLCVLGGLGAGLLLTGILGLDPEGSAVFVLSGLLGGVMGALATEREKRVAGGLLAAGMLLSMGISAFCFRDVLLILAAGILCALASGALTVGGYGYYGPLGWWSVTLLALSCLAGIWETVCLTGIVIGLVLTMDGFRDSSMRKGQLRDSHSPGLGNPAHILNYSYLLLLLFLPLCAVLGLGALYLGNSITGLLKSVSLGSAHGVSWVLYWIRWAIIAFLKWFHSLFHEVEDSGNGGEDGGKDYEMKFGDPGEGSMLLTIIFVAVCVLAVLFFVAAVSAALVKDRRRPRQKPEDGDYIDEVESLERPGLFRRRKLRQRQRLRDFDSPAMKIRFVFQQLLRQKEKGNPMACTRTPNELRDSTIPDEVTLIRAYNRVKYAQGPVSDQELAAAERYLKKL